MDVSIHYVSYIDLLRYTLYQLTKIFRHNDNDHYLLKNIINSINKEINIFISCVKCVYNFHKHWLRLKI